MSSPYQLFIEANIGRTKANFAIGFGPSDIGFNDKLTMSSCWIL